MDILSLVMIRKQIDQAEHIGQLRQLRDQMHEEFGRRLLFSHSLDWNRELNKAHDGLINRAITFAQKAVAVQLGNPPVPYAFVLYGSGGRSEQTLWSDQDNGIIYGDSLNELAASHAHGYFRVLAERISGLLMQLGYPPCTGEVACTNDQWRNTWSGYSSMLHEWLKEPNWEHVRYLLITGDMRSVYGESSLVDRLMDELLGYVAQHPIMLQHMLHNTLHHKVSLGLFGQLIKERYGEDSGGVDIKYGAYIPMVNGIRLLAIEAGIRQTSTEERILKLMDKGFIKEKLAQDWLEALSIALKLRSLTPFQIEEGQFTSRGKLAADGLTKKRISELKLCLRIGNDLQKYVKKRVSREVEKG
jgi:CBS domain-containing protein